MWIANLKPQGGTKYLQAVGAAGRLDPRAVVFVSDGAPEESADAILNQVKAQVRCPLHTIAVQASDQARDILGRMAAATKAGFHVVAQPSDIVDTFLDILGQIRQFRRFEMQAGSLALPDIQGELVAIGLDARPEVEGAAERQDIRLGGRPILVARTSYAARGAVTITAPEVAQGKRVIVLRFDQPSSRMNLGPIVIEGDRARVEASSSFHDPEGGPVDPRGSAKLSALFEAVDSQGKVIQSVPGRPSPTEPALIATLDLPIKEGAAVPFTVRMVSDELSAGAPFRASESQVVVVDPTTARRAPTVSTTSEIQARGGRAGERLSGTATITAKGGTAEERRAFLAALKARPSVVIVRPSPRTASGAAATASSVEVTTRIEADRALVIEFAWGSDSVPCAYEVALPQGEAGGVTYHAARAVVRTVAGDVLQLIVVAHRRRSARVVLFDSYQKPAELGYAIIGDEITVQLVRGKDHLTPPEFASLRSGLRARLHQDDGSVEDVPLSLQGDRFTTEPRAFTRPGRLTVHVVVEGLGVQLGGQIRIEPVALQLVVTDPPVWQTLRSLPQGTVAPLELSVVGTVGDRPGAPGELDEVIGRDELHVAWALRDGTGELLAGDRLAASTQPCRILVRLERAGEQALKLELVDGRGQVRHAIGWKLTVMDAPLRVEMAIRSDRGEVPLGPEPSRASWLPAVFLRSVPVIISIRPGESPIYIAYYLAECRVGAVAATFNKDLGRFEAEVERPDGLECTGTLRPYQGREASISGTYPELHVVTSVFIPPHRVLRWDRLGTVGALGLMCIPVGYVFSRQRYLRRVEAPAIKARLLGASGRAMPVVEPNQRGWRWPSPEILICRNGKGDEPWNLVLAYPADVATRVVLADVRQEPDGVVIVRARCNLPGLKAGRSRRLTPGSDSVLIAEGVRLVVESRTGVSMSDKSGRADGGTAALRILEMQTHPNVPLEPDSSKEMS